MSNPPSPPAPTGRPPTPLLTSAVLLGALTLAWIPAPTMWRMLAGLALCILFVVSETGGRRRWRSWHASTVAAVVRAAQRDRLTGLDTRAVADDLLDTATREGFPVTVALIDLDGLHAINDRLGHAGGDQYLVALAQRLAQAVPARGALVRQGGDEFTLITPAETSAEALAAAIGSVLPSPDPAGGVQPQASVGVATCAGRATGWYTLACADAAMYTAKNDGGNRVLVYDPARDGIPSFDGTRPPTRTRDRHRAGMAGLPAGRVVGVEVTGAELDLVHRALVTARDAADKVASTFAWIAAPDTDDEPGSGTAALPGLQAAADRLRGTHQQYADLTDRIRAAWPGRLDGPDGGIWLTTTTTLTTMFSPDDIDALVITAAEAVCGDPEDLSDRQRDLAVRAYRLLTADIEG